MISIARSVEEVVKSDYFASEGMARGVINLSEYARTIRTRVIKDSKKEVGVQSIVVALSRIQKKLEKNGRVNEVRISQLAVKSPVVQLVYQKNELSLAGLERVVQLAKNTEDVFFAISTSTKDIGLLLSESLEKEVVEKFQAPILVRKVGLSAVSIRFEEKLVKEANVGLAILQKLSSRNVVLDAVFTTYNEFTLIFESRYLNDTIATLSLNTNE